MGVNLSKGQRVSLEKSMTLALVGLGWDTNQYDGGFAFDLDACAFLLGENGKVLRDEDFVFYSSQKDHFLFVEFLPPVYMPDNHILIFYIVLQAYSNPLVQNDVLQ